MAFGPAPLDYQVLTLNPAQLSQTLPELTDVA
jgi:hypothetical protein